MSTHKNPIFGNFPQTFLTFKILKQFIQNLREDYFTTYLYFNRISLLITNLALPEFKYLNPFDLNSKIFCLKDLIFSDIKLQR